METDNVYFMFYTILAMAIRSFLSLHSYSGQNNPPMFGDYEAQRHWQEICVNLPPSNWYLNSSNNDLLYWGLDYPPLTALHSYLIGQVAHIVNDSYVELHKSRGVSSDHHKNFMRTSVLLSDLLLYVPAVILCSSAIRIEIRKKFINGGTLLYYLLYPGQILIDNGHFQYNNMSLGLMLLAIAAIFNDKDVTAAIFFSLALNYKQMELYHAVPIFIYLLRRCFFGGKKRFLESIMQLFVVAFAVVFIFFIVWLPWLSSFEHFISVVKRIFPIGRGIFEDKVANLWCAVNVFVKIKTLFTNDILAAIALSTTFLAFLPSSIHLFLHPGKINFLYALINSSLSFFLFSFQVHEKSILLAALPVLLIYQLEPFASFWFLQVTTFSMFPLFAKDGLTMAFVATNMLFYFVYRSLWSNTAKLKKISYGVHVVYSLSMVVNVLLQICHLFITPPITLPHIFPLLISVLCFIHFATFFLYFNIKQLIRSKDF